MGCADCHFLCPVLIEMPRDLYLASITTSLVVCIREFQMQAVLFAVRLRYKDSNGALPSATPVGLSMNMTEYPVDDAGRWMQNRLDGTIHSAFNTDVDGLVYDSDKEKFALLADDVPLDLYV